MKRALSLIMTVVVLISASSCKEAEPPEQTKAETTYNEVFETEAETEVEPENEDAFLIEGIETVPYPDPLRSPLYLGLTKDQQIAYNALAELLVELSEKGPDRGKKYYLEKRVDQVDALTALKHDGTDIGKAYAIAKWMADNVMYDFDYKEADSEKRRKVSTAYGALVEHEAICGGYSAGYDLLCKRAGLDTVWISGDSTESEPDSEDHAWNMMYYDGSWYHTDVTWMGPNSYKSNFMMPDEVCYFYHKYNAYCYWDQSTNEYIIPKAENGEHYANAYESFDEIDVLVREIMKTPNPEARSLFLFLLGGKEEVAKVEALNGTFMENKLGKSYKIEAVVFDGIACSIIFIPGVETVFSGEMKAA